MKIASPNISRRRAFAGFTFVELLVGLGLGSIVMTMVAALSVFSSRAFYSMSNYVDLDVHSRNAVDIIGRELREATALTDWKTNSGNRFFTLTNVTAQLVWDTANANINLSANNSAALSVPSLAPGASTDFYYTVTITRNTPPTVSSAVGARKRPVR